MLVPMYTVYSITECSQPSHRIMCLEEPTIVVALLQADIIMSTDWLSAADTLPFHHIHSISAID